MGASWRICIFFFLLLPSHGDAHALIARRENIVVDFESGCLADLAAQLLS